MVKIELKKNTTDFEMDEVQVTATYNLETVREVMENQKEVQQELKEVQLAYADNENVTSTDIENAINKFLDGADRMFSPVFGVGAVKRVYDSCNDIVATIEGFKEAIDYLNVQIEKDAKKQKNAKQKAINKYKK